MDQNLSSIPALRCATPPSCAPKVAAAYTMPPFCVATKPC
jgi:hypothetical protein